MSALWTWSSKNYWAIAIPNIVIGFFACFYGITIIKMVYISCGIILTTVTTWFLLYTSLLSDTTHNWVGWLILVGSTILGFGVGILFIKFKKLGVFFLGSIGGFGFGILLFNAAFYLTNSYVVLWSVTFGFALINGLLVLYESEHLIIHASALYGVFFLGTGAAMFLGHY